MLGIIPNKFVNRYFDKTGDELIVDSIVYDLFSKKFRAVDITNYNDDRNVGLLFFSRDAIYVLKKYYRLIGYALLDESGRCFPIDIRKEDIALFEGTYNSLRENVKTELQKFCLMRVPDTIISPFMFRWAFYGDFSAIDKSGGVIKVASIILGDERKTLRVINEELDIIAPTTYKELVVLLQNLNKIFNFDFYDKDYYEDVNYVFDSLQNGYHINMSDDEIEYYYYNACKLILKHIEEKNV